MGGIVVWVIILLVIDLNGWNTALWIFLIGSGLLLIGAVLGKTAPSQPSGTGTKRINHLHYIDVDEYECPKCGARFKKNLMTCPRCSTKFTGTKDNEDQFIEEMVLWDDDD